MSDDLSCSCDFEDNLEAPFEQLHEMLSRFNIKERSNGQGMDFGHVCTVTLTFDK